MNKIFSFHEYIKFLDTRSDSQTFFTITTGVYDGLHVGHTRYLKAAKNIDPKNMLVVGLFSDDLTRIRKGENSAIASENDRAEVLMELPCVDSVVILTTKEEAYAFIRETKPAHLVASETTRDEEYSSSTMLRLFGASMDVRVFSAQAEIHSSDWRKKLTSSSYQKYF